MPVAELKSQLTLDNKPFENSLDKSTEYAKKKAKETEDAFSKVHEHFGEQFAELGGAFVGLASIEGLKELVKGSIEFGAALGDASERLDITTDALQGLGFAFGQGGAKQEDFEKGMLKLNVAIAKARDGDENLIDSFVKLGVSVRSLEHDDPETILLEIADGMKNAKEPTEALAAAMEVLGKSGIKLVPGLKGGSEELEELAARAAKLSKEEIESLKAAGDAWEEFALRVKVYSAKALLHSGELTIGPGLVGKDFPAGYKAGGTLFPGDTGYKKPEDEERPEEGMRHARGRGFNEAELAKIEEQNKEEEEAEKIAEKSLARQQKEWLEIAKITKEIQDTQEETNRIGMTNAEMIVDLEKDRVAWIKEAERLERDEWGMHFKEATEARLQVAKLNKKISEAPRDKDPDEKPFTNSPRGRKFTPEEEAQIDLNEKFPQFKNFITGPFAGGGGLGAGPAGDGLQSGGLDSLGLNGGAHGLVRHGDAAREKAAMKAEKSANAGVESRLDEIKGLLGTSASPVAPKGGQN